MPNKLEALRAAAGRQVARKPPSAAKFAAVRNANATTPTPSTGGGFTTQPVENKRTTAPYTKEINPQPGEGKGDLAKIGAKLKKTPVPEKKYKGKYIGKERYKGLTKYAPKGKYKGKYIGPDKYKGDIAAWQKAKEERRVKRAKRMKGRLGTPEGSTSGTIALH